MANQKIRDELRRRGIRFWQLADAWGCSEPTVYRRLRHELPPEQRAEVMSLLRQISRADPSEDDTVDKLSEKIAALQSYVEILSRALREHGIDPDRAIFDAKRNPNNYDDRP